MMRGERDIKEWATAKTVGEEVKKKKGLASSKCLYLRYKWLNNV